MNLYQLASIGDLSRTLSIAGVSRSIRLYLPCALILLREDIRYIDEKSEKNQETQRYAVNCARSQRLSTHCDAHTHHLLHLRYLKQVIIYSASRAGM